MLSAFLFAAVIFVGCGDDSDYVSEADSDDTSSIENSEQTQDGEIVDGDTDRADVLISNDKLSLEVQIDSGVYSFPMAYDTFLSYGWTHNGDETAELEPDEYFGSEEMDNNGFVIQTIIINLDTETKPISECYVGGVIIEASNATSYVKVYLPGGFECFNATIDEVKQEYGTPSFEETQEDGTFLMEYEYDYFQVVSFRYAEEDGLLDRLEVQNMKLPEG